MMNSHFVVAIVDELDPQSLGRVRVLFPHLKMMKSDWCPIVMPMGGSGRGMVFMPEKGDHVVVALEHGDQLRGYVLGAIWNQTVKPPEADGKPKENNLRFIRSRSGHLIRFDDTKGKEKIEIIDKDDKHKIVIDSAQKKIQVESANGDVEVVAGSGNVSVKSGGKVEVQGATITMKSDGDLTVEAAGVLTLKGATVNIN